MGMGDLVPVVDPGEVAAVLLPRYELGRQLGEGGFGLVFAGQDRDLGRPVAIKVLTGSSSDDLDEARKCCAPDRLWTLGGLTGSSVYPSI